MAPITKFQNFQEMESGLDEAPYVPLASSEIVGVEHPFIIRNIEKGISSLGGPEKIDAVCEMSCLCILTIC